jgi:hypothetical protein
MQFIFSAVALGRQRNVDLFQNVLVHSVTILVLKFNGVEECGLPILRRASCHLTFNCRV